MLEKLIIICTVIITLNPANKLCTRATLTLNGYNDKGLIRNDNMETWQPVKQTRAAMASSSPASPSAPLMSTSTSTPSMKSSSSRISLIKKKQQQYLKAFQQTNDYIPYNHRSGNNSKFNITTSPLQLDAFTNIKFKPSYLLMLNTNKQLRHNPTHQHYPAKHTENVYPLIPKDIISQVKQPYMHTVTSTLPHNLHNRKADVNLHVRQPPPQHVRNIIPTPPTLATLNVYPSPIGTILSKDLNSIETENRLNDFNFPNEAAKTNSQAEAKYGDVANDVVNLNKKLMLLQKTFANVIEFYDNVKDILLSDRDNDDTYSNEDETDDDDNDLTMVNSALGSDVAAAATAAAATEKLSSLNMKNTIPLLTSLKGEVQGHKRQIDKGTAMKYSLIPQQNESENVKPKAAGPSEITARGLMWNITKAKSTLPSSALAAAAPASLSTFGTGRKLKKKLKKKFQKFLFPLVLAYKLKFLALIPLLIGGLTLLVGTTGLAGFFFALFTAVMSLKSGAKSAIVVKKYS